MTSPEEPQTLVHALTALMRWLDGEGIRGTIIGGVAASMLGRPRLTRDVDAVILADELGWDKAIESARSYQIAPRIDEPLEFATRTRVLLLRHVPTGVDIDVSLGALPFEREMIERSSMADLGPIQLRLPAAEDLIVMKALARRPRDIADIESILDAHQDLDLAHIRRWLREFSSVLEMPEIQEGFERLLRRKPASG